MLMADSCLDYFVRFLTAERKGKFTSLRSDSLFSNSVLSVFHDSSLANYVAYFDVFTNSFLNMLSLILLSVICKALTGSDQW